MARPRMFLRRFTYIGLAMVMAGILSGCSAIRGAPENVVDSALYISQLKCTNETDGDNLKNPQTCPLAPQAIAAAIAAGNNVSPEDRNAILGATKFALDLSFADFEQSITRGVRKYDFASTLVQLTIAALIATVGGETTKAALGAAETAIIGAEKAFKEDVLLEKAVQVLVTKMVGDRAVIAKRMQDGQAKTVAEYPMVLALGDLNDYYRAGTLAGALSSLSTSVGEETEIAIRELEDTTDAQALRNLTRREDGTADTSVFSIVKDCAVKLGIATKATAGDVATNILFPAGEEAKQNAAKVRPCVEAASG